MYLNLQSLLKSKFHGIRLWWMGIEYRYWAYIHFEAILKLLRKTKRSLKVLASQSNRDTKWYQRTKHNLGIIAYLQKLFELEKRNTWRWLQFHFCCNFQFSCSFSVCAFDDCTILHFNIPINVENGWKY